MAESAFSKQAVEELSKSLAEPSWMLQLRMEAFDIYSSISMPTQQDEPWRRTDIRALQLDKVGPLLNGRVAPTLKLPKLALATETAGEMTQAGGEVAQYRLSDELKQQGVVFGEMHSVLGEHEDLVRAHMMQVGVRPSAGKFAALHAAFWRGGTFLYVPPGVVVERPLHSMVGTCHGKSFGHTLVVVEPGAEVTLMESFQSRKGHDPALHNGVVELVVKDDARLKYLSIQEWGDNLWQFTHEGARVGKGAHLDWVVGVLGSRLTKSFQNIELDGRGAYARLSGLFFADGRQHLDLDTQQNHNVPDSTSDLLYKGALKDRARSVWQGMIRVRADAQRSNGYQANRNLLLAPTARADSIPGLEIEADDVRCTHGATVGQVDANEIFYLMSRGLARRDAIQLVLGGFFAPITERIPISEVRERVESSVLERI